VATVLVLVLVLVAHASVVAFALALVVAHWFVAASAVVGWTEFRCRGQACELTALSARECRERAGDQDRDDQHADGPRSPHGA
jgi:hypothetical protein